MTISSIYSQVSDREWPEWFIYPAKFPYFITGYSYNGYRAKEDAINNYYLYKICEIKGTLDLYSNSSSLNLYRNSEYFYDFIKDTSDNFGSKLKSVDKYIINVLTGDYIEVFTTDTTILPHKYKRLNETVPPPEWIDKTFYSDDVYYYGIGMYTSIGNDIDAWKTSEEKAIFSILRGKHINISKIKASEESEGQNNYFEELETYKLKYLVSGIEIVERYSDSVNKIYFVLARIKKNNLIVLL